MFRFLTTRGFFVNLIVILLLSVGLVFGVLQLLGLITKHGAYLTVPDVVMRNTNTSIKLLEDKGFDVLITDSVYIDSLPRGVVIKQIPDPNSTVKVNRTVLLVVNRVTLPMVDMPSLQGKSVGYAIELLGRAHLKLGDTTFKPDFAVGSVLEQRYQGNLIQAGAKLPYGSRVDLVVGGGLSNMRVPVPNLIGGSFGDAKMILETNGITLAGIVPMGPITDTLSAFVVKQSPEAASQTIDGGKILNYIQGGQIMDVWISQQMIYLTDSTSTAPKKPKKPKTEDLPQ